MEPYTTKTFEYYFYFPATAKAGAKFPHYPVNVAVAGTSAAAAKAFEFNVVAKLTQFDKASWDYVSQYGTDAETFAFIGANNIESLNMERIAWRCRQSADFFKKLTALMQQRHVWHDVIYSYAVVHNDTAALREWLMLFVELLEAKHGMMGAMDILIAGPEPLYSKTPHRLDVPIKALVTKGVATGVFRDDIEPHDLLRALAGVAHVRPSENWKRSAVRMVDILLKGMRPTSA